jgi:hypothetical protein
MKWIGAILFGGVTAVACGVGLYALEKVGFSLVLLMPLLAGAIVGFFTYLPTIRQRVATLPLALIAILAGALCISTYWVASYLFYQNEVVALFQEDDGRITRTEALEFMDSYYQETYGVTGIQGFLAETAEAGFTINRVGSSSSGDTPIQGTGAYLFWGLEAIVLIGMAFFTVLGRENTNVAKRFRTQENVSMDSAIASVEGEKTK